MYYFGDLVIKKYFKFFLGVIFDFWLNLSLLYKIGNISDRRSIFFRGDLGS